MTPLLVKVEQSYVQFNLMYKIQFFLKLEFLLKLNKNICITLYIATCNLWPTMHSALYLQFKEQSTVLE